MAFSTDSGGSTHSAQVHHRPRVKTPTASLWLAIPRPTELRTIEPSSTEMHFKVKNYCFINRVSAHHCDAVNPNIMNHEDAALIESDHPETQPLTGSLSYDSCGLGQDSVKGFWFPLISTNLVIVDRLHSKWGLHTWLKILFATIISLAYLTIVPFLTSVASCVQWKARTCNAEFPSWSLSSNPRRTHHFLYCS